MNPGGFILRLAEFRISPLKILSKNMTSNLADITADISIAVGAVMLSIVARINAVRHTR